MTAFLRVVFPIAGLFLVVVAIAGFFDIQAGPALAYLSAQDRGNIAATTTVTASSSSMTEVGSAPTFAMGGTPVAAVPTQTITISTATSTLALPTALMPTSMMSLPTATATAISFTPTIVPTITQLGILGTHIVRSGEYLFCIGRAYGVAPEAIANRNSLPVDATLSVGQELLIPDVLWVDIPPGKTCEPQFASRYTRTATPTSTTLSPSGLFPGEFSSNTGRPISQELYLVNFVLPGDEAKEADMESILLDDPATPEPVAETRTVKVELPQKMHLGESSQVVLFFDPVTGQPTVTVTSGSGDTITTTPMAAEPGQGVPNSLEIPDAFDDYWVYAVAHLNTLGFSYKPEGDVLQVVKLGKGLTWRWSIKPQETGLQELNINLRLHFEPKAEQSTRPDEEMWSDSFNVKVTRNLFVALFGAQASLFAVFSLITGSIMSIFPLWDKIRPLITKS